MKSKSYQNLLEICNEKVLSLRSWNKISSSEKRGNSEKVSIQGEQVFPGRRERGLKPTNHMSIHSPCKEWKGLKAQ